MPEDGLNAFHIRAVIEQQRCAAVPKIVRGHVRQAASAHKALDFARNGIRVAGVKKVSAARKQEHFIKVDSRMCAALLVPIGLQQRQCGPQQGNRANTGGCFWGTDDGSAFDCIGHIACNVERGGAGVNTLPLQSQTFAAADAGCDQQVQHTLKIQRTVMQTLKETLSLRLRECVHRPLFFLRRIHFAHRIFRNELLLFGVTENQMQCAVLM